MKIEKLPVSELKFNEENPRTITDANLKKLVKSVQEFPEMLEIRPIVINADSVVLGGNMRLKACIEAGITEVPVMRVKNLTKEQELEFIIKDNISGGDWDWDLLANDWDTNLLGDWGLNIKSDDFFELDGSENTTNSSTSSDPKGTDDDYSVFELVMLHENKLELLDTLNKIKSNFLFEKQEEALMELIRVYNKK
jgi:hypothetical protein